MTKPSKKPKVNPARKLTLGSGRVGVVLGRDSSALERFAANELCGYLKQLFGISTRPVISLPADGRMLFLIGTPSTNPHVAHATASRPLQEVSDQGIVLRRLKYRNCPTLVVTGGSKQAVLWAVYELAEHWGVTFLSDRDVIPQRSAGRTLPDLDIVKEPKFRVRAHPTIQDFAASGESWGMEHFQVLIDQLAKMKFNRLCIYTYGWQPFLHWEYKGIKRKSAVLWYDYRYHISSDMIGRELFGDEIEFWNPDLPLTTTYSKLVEAGIQLVQKLIAYGNKRGMECVVAATMTDFPPEFAPVLPGAERSHQLGGASIVPGAQTRMDDPNLAGMATAVLNATLDTYPEADRVMVCMPEFRQWTGEYKKAWDSLDANYGISEVLALSKLLANAKARGEREGDPERVITEVKADITSLYFYDQMLRRQDVPGDSRASKMKYLYWGPVEELFPILDRILPKNWDLEIMPTNHPATLLKRVKVLNTLPESISATMALTIDDDNIGVLPQLTTGALHRTIQVMKRRGWQGFTARERYPADHDVPLAYLARVSWEDDVTPEAVAQDVVKKICGKSAVEDMLKVFDIVEKVTETLIVTNFAFPADWPIPTRSNPGGMLLKHMIAGKMPSYMTKARDGYREALAHARRARAKTKNSGEWFVDFWIGRLEFAECYVECAQDVQRTANAEKEKDFVLFRKLADRALGKLEQGLRAYVRVARSQTDVGAIAVVNEHAYRPLKARSWAYHAHGANFLLPYL